MKLIIGISLRRSDSGYPIIQSAGNWLSGWGRPLLTTSANLSGELAPVAAEEISKEIVENVDCILDSGGCQFKIPSTVVKVDLTNREYTIVRPGVFPGKRFNQIFKNDLEIMYKVLFVCTANICRTPMAEYYFYSLVQKEGLENLITVESTGTWAADGAPPAELSRVVCAENGIDISNHRSQALDLNLMKTANLVLCMGCRTQKKI